MGRQFKGAFGGFQGQAGPLVGAYVGGQNVITSLHRKSNKPPTQTQRDQRSRFGLVRSHVDYILDLVRIGFKAHEPRLSAVNAAMSFNLLNAVMGVSPDFTIDYPKFSFSRGGLIKAIDPRVTSEVGSVVTFDWIAREKKIEGSDPDDQLNLMVYNPLKDEFSTMLNATARSEQTYSMQLPVDWLGDSVHCYMAFVSSKGKVSDSQYIQEVEIL